MTNPHSIPPCPNPQPNQVTPLYRIWRKLTPADFIVKQAITDLGGDCTQPEIASLTGLCTRQVIRSCQKLAQYGLLIIRKIGRSNSYRLPDDVSTGDKQVTPLVTDSDSILNTTNTVGLKINDIPQITSDVGAYPATLSSPDHSELGQDADADTVGLEGGRLMPNSDTANKIDQLVLLADEQQQALRALDIDPQQLPPAQQADLAQLEINPTLRQCFDTAPDLIKQHTPAQVLLSFDSNGAIAANLAHWRAQWQAGQADLTNLTPALIWTRIVEGKLPPSPKLGSPDWRGVRGEGWVVQKALSDMTRQGTNGEWRMANERQVESQDSASILWQAVLASLKGSVTKAMYDHHLAQSRLVMADNRYIISPANALSGQWLHHRLRPLLGAKISAQLGYPVEVIVELGQGGVR